MSNLERVEKLAMTLSDSVSPGQESGEWFRLAERAEKAGYSVIASELLAEAVRTEQLERMERFDAVQHLQLSL